MIARFPGVAPVASRNSICLSEAAHPNTEKWKERMADDRNVCSLCIQEGSLRDWLDGTGIEGDCDFDTDHTSVPCVTVDEFAEEADRLVSFSDCNRLMARPQPL
jgi:hypothetical protein